jgi:putative DNA methylase
LTRAVCQLYGLTRWGDLFNPRQKLALITFAEKVRQAHAHMLAQGAEPEFAKAVATYLALLLSTQRRLGSVSSVICSRVECTEDTHTFGRQALTDELGLLRDAPFRGSTGSWGSLFGGHFVYDSPYQRPVSNPQPQSHHRHGTATKLPWPDNYFDAVLTDPPYYDNVPYSDLSDFFYVWLKRTIGDLYPELFATPLTPKSEEMVADASKAGGMENATRRFEDMLTEAFREIHRVLKPTASPSSFLPTRPPKRGKP